MSSLLRRTAKYRGSCMNYQSHRTYFTGSRYSGYVNYFHNENLFGFVVREDAPEREYYFHVTDLHAENIPRVRPLQPVEFSIIEGRGGNFMARDISSLGGQPLRYAHANMKMKDDERNRNLSQLPNSELDRHTGVVVSIMPSGKGGLIVADRLNFSTLGYNSQEIQSTGALRLERFSEVEFYARPSKNENRDRAVCITRRGGGLITAERRNTGHSRRLLGAMYGPNDMQAQIPKDFAENRRVGYVTHYSREKLYGFVLPFDEPTEQGLFVHIDDCHIYGARYLKRFQEVEFNVVTDASTGKSKALHVSGPNKIVLRSVSDNRYIPSTLTTSKLTPDETQRHTGSVMSAASAVNYFIIKPDAKGYEPVIAYKNNVRALGAKRLQLDDCLEFAVTESSERSEGQLLRAYDITAPSGRPILCEPGELGRYLQTKMNLPVYQAELQEYDMSTYTKGTLITGFITQYVSSQNFGNIEIETMDANTRYRKVLFKLDDCALPSGNLDLERIFIRDGTKIQFELDHIDYETEFETVNRRKIWDKPADKPSEDDSSSTEQEHASEGGEGERGFHYEETEPLIHIKAMNIVSDGLDFLEVSEMHSAPPINTDGTHQNTARSAFGSAQQSSRFQLDEKEQPSTRSNVESEESLFDEDSSEQIKF